MRILIEELSVDSWCVTVKEAHEMRVAQGRSCTDVLEHMVLIKFGAALKMAEVARTGKANTTRLPLLPTPPYVP